MGGQSDPHCNKCLRNSIKKRLQILPHEKNSKASFKKHLWSLKTFIYPHCLFIAAVKKISKRPLGLGIRAREGQHLAVKVFKFETKISLRKFWVVYVLHKNKRQKGILFTFSEYMGGIWATNRITLHINAIYIYHDQNSVCENIFPLFQEFILSRVRYVERFCKGLLSQGEQNLSMVPIIERLL